MTKGQLDEVLDRVKMWPEERQEKAMVLLLALEDHDKPFVLTSEQRASIDRGLEQARRGEFVPDEEVRAFFDRHR